MGFSQVKCNILGETTYKELFQEVTFFSICSANLLPFSFIRFHNGIFNPFINMPLMNYEHIIIQYFLLTL